MLPKPTIYAYEFPAYEGINLNITGNMSGNYSNNITFAQDDEEKIDQFSAMLLLGLGVRYEGKRRTLAFDGKFRQPLYNSADVRNSSEILTVDVTNDFSKFDRVRLRNTYTHTKVPGSFEGSFIDEECRRLFEEFGIDTIRNDPVCSIFENEFGRAQGEFDTHRNKFLFNYTKYLSERIHVEARYNNEIFNTSLSSLNNSLHHNLNSTINYQLSHVTSFYLFYAFSDTSYDEGGNIPTNSFRAGGRQYLTKRLYVSGDIGMVFTPSTNNTLFGVNIVGELDKKTSTVIDFTRDVRAAVDTENIFKSWRINGRLNRSFSEDLNSNIAVFYGEGNFITVDITDKLLGGSFSLSYRFWDHKRGPNMKGTLGYTYSSLHSTLTNREYERNSITASLTIAF
jgi:hypothetical protein